MNLRRDLNNVFGYCCFEIKAGAEMGMNESRSNIVMKLELEVNIKVCSSKNWHNFLLRIEIL